MNGAHRVEALLHDEPDPKDDALEIMGRVTTDQLCAWFKKAGMTDYNTLLTTMPPKRKYLEIRGYMEGTFSGVTDRLVEAIRHWGLNGQAKWAVDSAGPSRIVSRGVQVLIPSEMVQ